MVLFPFGVTFCDWTFLFSRSKESDANIGIIANFVKNPNNCNDWRQIRDKLVMRQSQHLLVKWMTLSVLKTNQRRIPDSPKERAPNLQEGVLTYKICQIFPNNCMKLRKFWSVGGTPEPILTCSLWRADCLKESCGYLTEKPSGINHSRFFHNSRLIRRIKQTKIYNKFRDLTRDWT